MLLKASNFEDNDNDNDNEFLFRRMKRKKIVIHKINLQN